MYLLYSLTIPIYLPSFNGKRCGLRKTVRRKKTDKIASIYCHQSLSSISSTLNNNSIVPMRRPCSAGRVRRL